MEFQSKNDEDTFLSVDINDLGEVVLSIKSRRNPIPQYFVVRDGDLPNLYHDIGEKYIGYVEYVGGLLD